MRTGDPVGTNPADDSGPELLSIQERLYPSLPCFGCGHANAKGLRLRSYPGTEAVTATFTPWPEHDNGLGYLNGGIIATLLDCHSAAAVTLEAEQRAWPALPGAALPYVTAGLDVRYLRPSPLHEPVELVAVVTSASETEMLAEVELMWQGKPRATATARWRRWRPR
jgi:acyl-coenzyme A thioesterase PaaI-like protein